MRQPQHLPEAGCLDILNHAARRLNNSRTLRLLGRGYQLEHRKCRLYLGVQVKFLGVGF